MDGYDGARPAASHVAFRVAAVIGYAFNKHAGEAFLALPTIAEKAGISARWAWKAVHELEQAGYLDVRRRDLGTGSRTTKDGKTVAIKFAGGKGVANVYKPTFERQRLGATNRGAKLVARCEEWWKQSATKEGPQRSRYGSTMVEAERDPTLASPSEKNPTDGFSGFGKAEPLLRRRLGDDVFQSWLAKVRVERSDTTVVVYATTKFIADWVGSKYIDTVLDCLTAVDRAVKHVEVRVGGMETPVANVPRLAAVGDV